MDSLAIEAARQSFLAAGPGAASDGVRPEIVASWQRSWRHDVDVDRMTARFVGHATPSPVVECAEDVFDDFFKINADADVSLIMVDTASVVRVRRDGQGPLARLLDLVLLIPGYEYAEGAVGTTAAAVALHENSDFVVCGPEHYHHRLRYLSEAAALVPDPRGEMACGVVMVIGGQADQAALWLPLARLLAQQIADRMAGGTYRRSLAILDRFGRCCGQDAHWVLATDGDWVTSNAAAPARTCRSARAERLGPGRPEPA